MMDFLMKQLGIDPEVVQKELPEVIKKITTFDARLARIEKALGCDEQEMQIAELTRKPLTLTIAHAAGIQDMLDGNTAA